MLQVIRTWEDVVLLYDADEDKCVITVEDAALAAPDTLVAVKASCDKYKREIRLVGQYLHANRHWLSTFATDEALKFIIDSPIVTDYVRDDAITEIERRQKERIGYVYLLKADNGLYKIGQAKIIDRRIAQLAVSLPYELELEVAIQTERYKELEPELHERFSAKRKRGEWFELNEADIEYIKKLES
jgi:hypothetical protein